MLLPAAALFASTKMGDPLGLKGGQGEYYKPGQAPTMDTQAYEALGKESAAASDVDTSNILAKYGQGQSSLGDALSGLGSAAGKGRLTTDALSGSQFATEQVQRNPILGQIFGKDGTMGRTVKEEQDLASRGFSLKPEDYEAYGQASGDIARMFGTQEQSLAQALAQRGLAAAPSGAAGVGYSGLMGNKFEQLAGAQRKIADDRMKMNLERLGQTRSYLNNLTAQGAGAIQDQFGRQVTGEQLRKGDIKDATQAALNKYQADIGKFSAQEEANMQSQMSKDAAKKPSLLESFGRGLHGSATSIGAAPGTFTQSLAKSGPSAMKGGAGGGGVG